MVQFHLNLRLSEALLHREIDHSRNFGDGFPDILGFHAQSIQVFPVKFQCKVGACPREQFIECILDRLREIERNSRIVFEFVT